MLWRNSPLGRLNFLMLSADAETKAFLKKIREQIKSECIILHSQRLKEKDNYSFGWSAIARTAFLWFVRVAIVLPDYNNKTIYLLVNSAHNWNAKKIRRWLNVKCTISKVPKFNGRIMRTGNNLWVLQHYSHHQLSYPKFKWFRK